MPVYTSAKAAVHSMTRSFARDLGEHRIRVNTVVQGWVMTARQKELFCNGP
jgi:NAD(P)-dependent dehydrogenase (short-subunit alcohol dehydrogenase family)